MLLCVMFGWLRMMVVCCVGCGMWIVFVFVSGIFMLGSVGGVVLLVGKLCVICLVMVLVFWWLIVLISVMIVCLVV